MAGRKITILRRNVVLTETKGKKMTVVGLARSGVGAANILSELGAEVTVTDVKNLDVLKDYIAILNPSVRLRLEQHPDDLFANSDLIVVSPGVSLDIPQIKMAKERGIPIIGELELAYQTVGYYKSKSGEILNDNSAQSETIPHFLAVTGTNGKSTTTALLDFMMRKSGFKTILGGNIGNALTEEILKYREDIVRQEIDYIVVEVSSFQLESIENFRPKASVITNITPDHFDRYHSLKEYVGAKARIFENQKENDFLILNRDDAETMKLYFSKLETQKAVSPKVYFFSRKEMVEGLYFKDGVVYCDFPEPPVELISFPLIREDEIKIRGVHNLENAMAASAMALLANCGVEAVKEALIEFPGLEHRLEFVRELHGVKYYNDSKGTNVGAVIKSIESFSDPIILIAGGRDKAGDFSLLRDPVRDKVKAAVLIGEAREKIKKVFFDITETFIADDLKEAVNITRKLASTGDVVLLSPACASFDMFRDFEDRGRQFKKIVMEMNNGQFK